MKNILSWLATNKAFGPVRKIIRKIVPHDILSKIGGIVYYNNAERSVVFRLIKQIKNEKKMTLNDKEAYQIYMAVRNTHKTEGEIAEVGVYKGGSAKLICEAKGNKPLHLFDTFEGVPALSPEDNAEQFYKGQYVASIDEVKEYLSQYPFVHIYKGFFPLTAGPINNITFSFVHIDVDIYESTVSSLIFFYPRMNRGGIIIIHDYLNAPGVKKAVDNFFKDKPEPVIELAGYQCLIVKV